VGRGPWLGRVSEEALLANAILGLAALVASATGFGYALMATPFLAVVLEPRDAVGIVLVSWLPLAVLLVRDSYREMNLRRVSRLFAVAALGVPLGAYGLARLDATTMRAAIGAITLVAAAALSLRHGTPFRRAALAGGVAGLLSGVLAGASAMSGPPVVLYALKQGWEHRGMRADLIAYFVALHVLTLALFGHFDLVNERTLSLSLWAQPGVLGGFVLGMQVKARLSQERYRRLAVGLVCLGGLLALVHN